MQRLAFIIVIPMVLAALFLVVWGAIKNEPSFVSAGLPVLATSSGAAIAYYFPNKLNP
jgi:hypothetical protein